MWMLIISLVAILIAAVLGLGGGLINFLDRHANIIDNQYLPMDLERGEKEVLKKVTEQVDHNTLEQLRKKFEERQAREQGKARR